MRPIAVVLLAIINTCYTARLDSTYLPPANAGSAGGAGLIYPPGHDGNNINKLTLSGSSGSTGFGPVNNNANVYPNGGESQNRFGSQEIPITSYSSENDGDGNYQFSYETGNGITVQESGYHQGESESVSGSFSYTGPDGVQYAIKYTADEEGFHPQGAHLPTPPPIPPEIQRGIELALAAEARGENQDTSDEHFHKGNDGGNSHNGYGDGRQDAYQGPNSYQTSSSGGYQY